MGYYLNTPEMGATDKAMTLKMHYGAQVTLAPATLSEIPSGRVLICVIENGPFDAAAVIYNRNELDEFKYDPTTRPKTWMLMDRDKVLQLTPQVEKQLSY